MGEQLSLKAAIPLAEILATCRKNVSNTGPWPFVITFPKCQKCGALTHWGRVTHICISKLTIIHSDNGLLPERRQNLIWTNAKILLIGHLGTNFSENLIGIKHFHSRKCTLKCRLQNGVHFISKDCGDLAMAMAMCWPVWALQRWGNFTLKY